jgi:hypothetical protein
MAAFPTSSAVQVTTAATTTINKNQPCLLMGICVNKALTGTVTVADGTSTIAVLTNGTTAPLGMTLNTPGGIPIASLTVVNSATEDFTILYSA